MRVAVYPGSFDPITNGHIDIAERAARLFDRLIVAIYEGNTNSPKQPLFPIEQRVAFAEQSLCQIDNITIDTFNELLVDYARRVGQ